METIKQTLKEILSALQNLSVSVDASDLQIGAVEIKDGSSDTRATVGANGVHVDLRTTIQGENEDHGLIETQIKPVVEPDYSANRFSVFGTDVDLSVTAVPGHIFSVIASNKNASVRYLQIHNKASAPSSGNAPILSFPIPGGTTDNPGILGLGREIFGQGGQYLSTGLAIGISTAEATFTAATTTDHDYYGEYV